MEDGAPAHRAKKTQDECNWYNMPSLKWPPAFTDLNPVENVWKILKDRLDERVPKPERAVAMKAAILEEWEGISAGVILKLVDSMPERLAAVIAANGGHTRW